MAQLKDTKINGSASIEDALVVKGTSLFQNNVTIKGDLFVSGNLTTVDTDNLVVKDKLIEIASGSATAAAADGAGVLIQGASASLTYDASKDAMVFNKALDVPQGITHKIVISSSVDGVNFNSAEYNGSADANLTINLHDYSASVATKIAELESSSAGDVSGLVQKIDNVYASHSALDTKYTTDSASFNSRINNVAATASSDLTALSTSIAATTNAIDTKADNIYASHSADSASFDKRITAAGTNVTTLSSSVATTTNNLNTKIDNVYASHSALETKHNTDSASFATDLANVAATASSDLAAASQSISSSLAAEVARATAAEATLSESIASVSGDYLSKVDATAANKMQVDLQMNGNKVALADGVNIYYDSTAQAINFEFPN